MEGKIMGNGQDASCLGSNIRILHLSDLQFGFANRFVGAKRYDDGADFESFSEKIAKDVLTIWDAPPDIIIITGDIAESAAAPEYKVAKMFFNRLLSLFSNYNQEIPMLFFVPGNHDVSWQDTKAAENMNEPYPWCEDKFRNYNSFIKQITKSDLQTFRLSRNYYVKLVQNKILILGFNSAINNSHREEDQKGYIGIEMVQSAIKKADEIDPTMAIPRIAIMHHNFTRASQNDEENLIDADEIRKAFEEGGIDFILHGHRHSSGAELRRNLIDQRQIAILSTGSAGLDTNRLPDIPNQMQLIEINLGVTVRTTIYRRAFSAQTIGISGKGVWITDSSEIDQGFFTFYLHREKIGDIIEAIQRRLKAPLSEEKAIHCPWGFETHNLYETVLNIADKRLWIIGRKNRKLFDKDHKEGLMKIAEKQRKGFDLRIMFLSPKAPHYIIERSHQDEDIDIQLSLALRNAKKMCSRYRIDIPKSCRMYSLQRTIAMIIIDNLILYYKIHFDRNSKAKPVTGAAFEMVCADTEYGRGLIDDFLEFWNNGEPF